MNISYPIHWHDRYRGYGIDNGRPVSTLQGGPADPPAVAHRPGRTADGPVPQALAQAALGPVRGRVPASGEGGRTMNAVNALLFALAAFAGAWPWLWDHYGRDQ